MITILALSVVGSWSYGGFLAEPSPAPSPTPEPEPPPASAPVVPEKGPKSPEPERPAPAIPALAPAANPPADPPPISAKPTLYRSTDASGQTWEHPDSAYLSSFVETRNRSFVTYTYTYASPRSTPASRCYNGRCN